MKKVQVKALSTEELVEEFRTLSAGHGHDIEDGKPKAANRKYDVLVAIRKELRERGMDADRHLLGLLDDPEPGTRYWAASSVLDFAPTEAEQVLSELAKIPKSLVGFTAELTLRQWKAGTFKPA
jgi:hypothetical protein